MSTIQVSFIEESIEGIQKFLNTLFVSWCHDVCGRYGLPPQAIVWAVDSKRILYSPIRLGQLYYHQYRPKRKNKGIDPCLSEFVALMQQVILEQKPFTYSVPVDKTMPELNSSFAYVFAVVYFTAWYKQSGIDFNVANFISSGDIDIFLDKCFRCLQIADTEDFPIEEFTKFWFDAERKGLMS